MGSETVAGEGSTTKGGARNGEESGVRAGIVGRLQELMAVDRSVEPAGNRVRYLRSRGPACERRGVTGWIFLSTWTEEGDAMYRSGSRRGGRRRAGGGYELSNT